MTGALNYEKIKKDPQRVSKIKPFIDQYNCNKIDLIRYAYKSKYNLNCETQVILLMITDGEK